MSGQVSDFYVERVGHVLWLLLASQLDYSRTFSVHASLDIMRQRLYYRLNESIIKRGAMKYSQATNYALHTMLYFVALPTGTTIGVQQLAELQKLSPTYLSKILTKLVKSGLIESTPGSHGGYTLTKSKEDISFLDVINAIEGTASLFHCGAGLKHDACVIQHVMLDAEQRLEAYLQERKLVEYAADMPTGLGEAHLPTR
jgi:Rrf2 family protein